MSVPEVATYRLDEVRPRGRLAIEASAGTGKTFTLVTLAVRAIAEDGVPASQLLVVTFTRAATSELRSRLRERLVDVAAAMAGDPSVDPLALYLASSERALRRERINRALSEFDTATITTIHGFATQVLGTLGATSGTDPDARLVDNSAELLDDACADVLARAAALGVAHHELPTFDQLRSATRTAMAAPDTALVPASDDRDIPAEFTVRTRLVEEARRVIARRRQRAGTMSFDDLLTQFARGAARPERARDTHHDPRTLHGGADR